MKKILLSLFAVTTMAVSGLQAQNNVLSLPPNYLDVQNQLVQPLPAPGGTSGIFMPNYAGQQSEFTHAAMQDINGDLLFFIVDGIIYDKNGLGMGTLDPNLGFGSTAGLTELIIVPVPGNCQQYYIVGTFSNKNPLNEGATFKPFYAILDFSVQSVNGRLGTLVDVNGNELLNVNIFDLTTSITPNWGGPRFQTVTIAVSKLRADNTRFLFASNGGNVWRYKVTSTGITFDNSFFNLPLGDPDVIDLRSEMELYEFSNGNYRIAVPYASGSPTTKVFISDLNNNGDLIPSTDHVLDFPSQTTGSNPKHAEIKGMEFSPNGRYLYLTHLTNSLPFTSFPFKIYDVNTSSFVTPVNAGLINDIPNFQHSTIELGKDGKLYFANATNLATIDNADFPLSTLSWNNNQLAISYNLSAFNLSNPNINHPFSLYILPDQIDGMDYTAHFTATPACCREFSNYSISSDDLTHEYSGTHTWSDGFNTIGTGNLSSPITIKDQLIIKSGANITINNMTFEFAPEAQLIIENGAKLTINNTVLTVDNRCDNAVMWHGVEVWGTGSGSFQPATSGEFIANNSLIEHAVEATANYRHDISGGTPFTGIMVVNTTGGILKLTNTTLRNNKLDVNMLKYQSMVSNIPINDRSIFKNCDFVTDALLKDLAQLPLNTHVQLNAVNGIRFLGCDFRNIAPLGTYSYMQRENGILAQETKLSVEAFCTVLTSPSSPCPAANLDKSTFTNLVLGVRATSANSLNTASITNSEFFDVWRSISLGGLDAANVSDNIFDIGMNNRSSTGSDVSYGLALVGCDGYKVENNDFHTSFNGYLGTVTVNSGVGANEIYRNTFTDLTIGSQAMLENGDGQALTSAAGLEFRCNEYENTSDYDILISSGVIKAFHGNCTNNLSPSNNQFSYTAQLGDFWGDDNLLININYIFSEHNPSLFNLAPRDGFYNQTANPHFTTIFECSVANTNLTQLFDPLVACPKRVTRTRTQLANLRESLKVIINDLNNQIDNGNTQSLLNLIASSSGGILKDSLLSVSPYLSDEVLIAYILSNPSAGHLKQILIANSPLSNKVLRVLENEILPKGVKNQIDNVQVGISPRQELEGEIAYYEAELRKAEFDVIRLLLFDFSDENKENFQDVVDFLEEDEINNTNNQNQMLVNAYLANNDFNNAQQKLMQIHADTVNADFCKLKSTIIACQQFSEKEMAILTQPNLQQNVNEVATATSTMQEVTSAQMLLEQVGLNPISIVDVEMVTLSNNLRVISSQDENNKEIINDSEIRLFPNPANANLTISHNLAAKEGAISLEIMDLMGRVLMRKIINNTNNQININSLSSGLYFYTVLQNGNAVQSGKLVVE